MPGRVEIHPKRLSTPPREGRPDGENLLFARVEIGDFHIEVKLLRNILAGPLRSPVVVDLLKRHDRPRIAPADELNPVGLAHDLPHSEQLGIEIREQQRVGAIQNNDVKCADHHSSVGSPARATPAPAAVVRFAIPCLVRARRDRIRRAHERVEGQNVLMAEVRIEPASEAGWGAVEHALTGGGDGASCWCQWFLLSRRDFEASSVAELRALLRHEVEAGAFGAAADAASGVDTRAFGSIADAASGEPAYGPTTGTASGARSGPTTGATSGATTDAGAASPGLIAFVGDEAAGWVRVGPRAPQLRLMNSRVVKSGSPEPAERSDVWAITCLIVRREYRGRGLATQLVAAATQFAAQSGARVIEAYPIDTDQRTASNSELYVGSVRLFAKNGFRETSRPLGARVVMSCLPESTLRHKVRA
ncbi:MAG: family N-acetyltransferase [Subtercola sp.]|nr:family N-acetyltransferase [Subtercola sp.]